MIQEMERKPQVNNNKPHQISKQQHKDLPFKDKPKVLKTGNKKEQAQRNKIRVVKSIKESEVSVCQLVFRIHYRKL